MSKKSKKKKRKLALKFIKRNRVILHKLGESLGCDPDMKDKD
jgi:hypothetical protein